MQSWTKPILLSLSDVDTPVTPVLLYILITVRDWVWGHGTDAAPLQATPGPRFQEKPQGHGVLQVNLRTGFYLGEGREGADISFYVVERLGHRNGRRK